MTADASISLAQAIGELYAQLQAQIGTTPASILALAIGITFYAIIIGLFYKNFSKRELFVIDWSKVGPDLVSQVLERLKFIMEYIIVFPLLTFLWFVVLSLTIFFMSKTGTVHDAIFISISLVASTRICAYYDEDIAVDIAKMVPLAILAVFITEPSAFSAAILEQRLEEIVALLDDALPFLAMLMLLEVILRILFMIKRAIAPEHLLPESFTLQKVIRREEEKQEERLKREKKAGAGGAKGKGSESWELPEAAKKKPRKAK